MSGSYQHQLIACERYKNESMIPLFFDPGTGKSKTALDLASIKYNNGQIDALLVVAPNKIHKQWAVEQIPLWMKDIPTVVVWKKNPKSLPFVEGKLNIVCVNIDVFSTTSNYIKYVDWVNAHKTMIILDEATRIKNPKALRTQRMLYSFNTLVKRGRSIIKSEPKTVCRAILTGTPITNGAFDVWSMFEFLQPSFFGMNWYAFQNKYGMFYSQEINGRIIRILINEDIWKAIKACKDFQQAAMMFSVSLDTYTIIQQQSEFKGPYKNIDSLIEQISKVAMFVKIEDCLDMPDKVYNRKMLDMTPEQAKVYYDMERDLLATYKDEITEAKTKIAAYIRLQQIASGFISSEQLPENEDDDPPPNKITWFDKKPKIDQLLIDLEEINGQCIIITHFSAEASMIYDTLTSKGYKCGLQTGWRTVGTIEGFKEQRYQILVANIRVISMGFNLQANCNHMIFYSNTFSAEDRIQCEARIYRAGQEKKCIYIDYIMVDTIDMKIYAALKQKRDLSDYFTQKSLKSMLTERDEVFEEEYHDYVAGLYELD